MSRPFSPASSCPGIRRRSAGRRLGGGLRGRARRAGGAPGLLRREAVATGAGWAPGNRAGARVWRKAGTGGVTAAVAGKTTPAIGPGSLAARGMEDCSRREAAANGPGATTRPVPASGARSPGTKGYDGAVAAGSRRDGYEWRPATSGVTAARSRRSNAQSPHPHSRISARSPQKAGSARSPAFWGPGAQQPPVSGRGGQGETDPLSRTCRPAPHSPVPSTAHTAAAAHPGPAP